MHGLPITTVEKSLNLLEAANPGLIPAALDAQLRAGFANAAKQAAIVAAEATANLTASTAAEATGDYTGSAAIFKAKSKKRPTSTG